MEQVYGGRKEKHWLPPSSKVLCSKPGRKISGAVLEKSKNAVNTDKINTHERVLHKENIFEAIRKIHEEAIHVKGRTLTHKFREMYGISIPQWTLKLFTDL